MAMAMVMVVMVSSARNRRGRIACSDSHMHLFPTTASDELESMIDDTSRCQCLHVFPDCFDATRKRNHESLSEGASHRSRECS